MALQDILDRIEADAKAEADAIRAAAQSEADAKLASARDDGSRIRETVVARARADAEREAATLAANARLKARDTALTARQGLAAEVLRGVEDALLALPGDRYAALIAAETAAVASGGETLRIANADSARLGGAIDQALKAKGVSVTVSSEAADIEHGVLLVGDRTRVEISPAAMVASRRDELLARADAELSGEGRGQA